ncbi:MAG TPA: HAMP domain-containing sensor histidine kinase [Demequinaceae bacterium]
MTTTLRARLLASHLIVAAVGAGALVIVAAIVTNVAFRGRLHDGMGMMGGPQGKGNPTTNQLQSALSESLAWALVIGVVAAVLTAGVAAIFVARRISQPVEQIRAATHRMARGEFRSEIPLPADAELAELARDVNALGARLAESELHRSRLIGEVAHELRTPLTTIRASMEGLIDGVVAPDPKVFARIAEEASRLHRLADDLTLLSQAEESAIPLRPVAIDLGTVAASASARLAAQFEDKGVALVVSDFPPLPVRADPDRVTQILTNLLGNAMTHTPEGGSITVSGGQADGNAWIAVADTGSGIPADQVDRVFERFYRVPDASHPAGRGIGLTIARGMARAHGGDVTATSDGIGKGTTFRLTLPA